MNKWLVSIDPGINYTGMAFVKFDEKKKEILDFSTYLIETGNGKIWQKINNLHQSLFSILIHKDFLVEDEKIDYILLEIPKPFIRHNRRRRDLNVSSVMKLSQALGVIRLDLYRYYKAGIVFESPPLVNTLKNYALLLFVDYKKRFKKIRKKIIKFEEEIKNKDEKIKAKRTHEADALVSGIEFLRQKGWVK